MHLVCVFRSFTSLCYSADGESVLAGGLSKFVCIYNIKEQMLVKKFEISSNLSFDAMEVSWFTTVLYINISVLLLIYNRGQQPVAL